MPSAVHRALNERLDEQKDRYVTQAEVALREQEEKLSRNAPGSSSLLPEEEAEGGVAMDGDDQLAEGGDVADWAPPHAQLDAAGASQPVGSSAVRDTAAVEPELDEAMGTAAQLRYQKARMEVLQEELEKTRSEAASKASVLLATEKELKEAQQQRAKLERNEKALQASLEREKAATAEQRQRADKMERELAMLRKETEEVGRGQRNALGELRGKDVRLNRALEELERYRTQLREMREARDGAGQDARADAQRLAAENARLKKRQSDLVLAFKKQAKLIDVLKRQKLHVEAARMLSFTEEEFSRTLELGEQMAGK